MTDRRDDDPARAAPGAPTRLWVAPVSGVVYRLPETHRWTTAPDGVLVCALDGEMARVSPRALIGHAVATDEATREIRDRMLAGARATRGAGDALWQDVRRRLPGIDAVVAGLAADDADLRGPALLAALTGRTVADVERDPAGARGAVDQALAELAGALPTPTGAEADGGPAAPTPEESAALAEQLQRWLGGPRPTAGWTEDERAAVADAMGHALAAGPPAADLHRALARLRTALGADPLTAEGRARQQAAFRADAKARIARDTAGWQAPKLSFGALLARGRARDGDE